MSAYKVFENTLVSQKYFMFSASSLQVQICLSIHNLNRTMGLNLTTVLIIIITSFRINILHYTEFIKWILCCKTSKIGLVFWD